MRFYQREMPYKGELVYAQVKTIEDEGGYMHMWIPEYESLAIMRTRDLTKKGRLRSLCTLAAPGKEMVVEVLTINSQTGSIDVGRRYVSEEEDAEYKEYFRKTKQLNSIVQRVSHYWKKDPYDKLIQKIVWPLFDEDPDVTEKHPIDIFEMNEGLQNVLALLDDVDEGLLRILKREITKALTRAPRRFATKVRVRCLDEDGISVIRDIVKRGGEIEGESMRKTTLRISYETESVFNVFYVSEDKEKAEKCISDAIVRMQEAGASAPMTFVEIAHPFTDLGEK